MPNRFGRGEDNYEALKVRSLGGSWLITPGGGEGGGNFAAGNNIYVWHSDLTDIELFEPNAAGLVAALAAAVSGDTVWLPSVPIASTAGVTIPEGVTLCGISDNAALLFSGFSGAAITLSTGSALFGFSLVMTATGADAIGVDARAASVTVEHLDITVSGGATRNVRVLTGVNAQSSVIEIWSIDRSVAILWAETTGGVGDSPAWNTIAFPSGYAAADHIDEFANSLQIDHLGHYLYLCGKDTNNSNRGTIWQLDNLAAIRATPATAPSWSVIAYHGQVVSAGTLKASTYINSFYIRCFGDSLYMRAENSAGSNTILGVYDGAAWTWRAGVGGDADKSFQAVYGDVYAALNLTAGSSYLRDWLTDAIIGSGFSQKFGIDHFAEIWRRFDAPNYYTHPVIRTISAVDHVYLHETTTGTETEISASGQDTATVRGAYTSDAVYSVDAAGDLRVSSNGLTYSNVATWALGWAMNTIIDGSGDLLWLVKSQSDTNPVVRLYSTAGTLLDDLTGDLWTVLGHPGGTINFDQMLLVYGNPVDPGDLPIIADLHAGSANGTGAADVLIDGEAIVLDADLDVLQVDAGTVYVRDVSYTTHSGAGTIDPMWGDRGVWDVTGYPQRHASDIDAATFDYHNDPAVPPILTGDAAGGDLTGTYPDPTIANDAVTYAKMQDISATQRVLGRNTAGSGDPEEVTVSQLLDWIGSTRGAVLYRGASGWAILDPGTAGYALASNGAGADPSYQQVSAEVLMADGVTPPDPLTTEDETDWLYEG